MNKHAKLITLVVMTLACARTDPHFAELKEMARTPGNRAEAQAISARAFSAHQQKKYSESERLWFEAAKKDPSWSTIYFNLACSTALQGRLPVALEYLKITLSLDATPAMVNAIRSDPDLAALRSSPLFAELKLSNEQSTPDALKDYIGTVRCYRVKAGLPILGRRC